MLEAKHLLLAAAAFVEDARAYIKGQLVCGPIREDVLWERWVPSLGPPRESRSPDTGLPTGK